MNRASMLTYFRELYNLSSHTNDGKEDEEIDLYLNLAQSEYVDSFFLDKDGQRSIRNEEEIFDNLRTLFTNASLTLSSYNTQIPNAKSVAFPSGLRYKLSLRVELLRSDTNPTTSWYIAKPLNPVNLHKYIYNSKNNPIIPIPYFTILENKIFVIADNESTIQTTAYIDYIKEPAIITSGTDCELPANTHFKIVERAVNIALKASSIEPNEKIGIELQENRQ